MNNGVGFDVLSTITKIVKKNQTLHIYSCRSVNPNHGMALHYKFRKTQQAHFSEN